MHNCHKIFGKTTTDPGQHISQLKGVKFVGLLDLAH